MRISKLNLDLTDGKLSSIQNITRFKDSEIKVLEPEGTLNYLHVCRTREKEIRLINEKTVIKVVLLMK